MTQSKSSECSYIHIVNSSEWYFYYECVLGARVCRAKNELQKRSVTQRTTAYIHSSGCENIIEKAECVWRKGRRTKGKKDKNWEAKGVSNGKDTYALGFGMLIWNRGIREHSDQYRFFYSVVVFCLSIIVKFLFRGFSLKSGFST